MYSSIMDYLQRGTVSNHDIHRYADLRNAGIVRSAEEFHDLHPFVRAHAGRRSAYGLTVGVSGGAVTTSEQGVIDMSTRESAQAMSAWLSGKDSFQR